MRSLGFSTANRLTILLLVAGAAACTPSISGETDATKGTLFLDGGSLDHAVTANEAGPPPPDTGTVQTPDMAATTLPDMMTPVADSAPSCPSGFHYDSAAAVCKSASGIPRFSHVFIIFMENNGINNIIGNTGSAMYINTLANKYALADKYYDVSHPSLPNYLALTNGKTWEDGSDCDPTVCPITNTNLADLIEGAGLTWHSYAEGEGSPCNLYNTGEYAPRHNPFVYYTDIQGTARCTNNVVDIGDATHGFIPDLAAGNQNLYTLTPNLCDDMHDDCGTGDPIQQGDTWLSNNVPPILNSAAWKNNGVLFIVWDESETGDQIAALVISPLGKPAYKSTTVYNHYSLLRTIEDAWGLTPITSGGSSTPRPTDDADATPMADFFK
jgi:hypothetical protein